MFYVVKLAFLQLANYGAHGAADSHRDSAVRCARWWCRLSSQFEAHPPMVKVAPVQQYLLADRTFVDKTMAFVEPDSALIIRANAQIDLLDDLSIPRPGNERVKHQGADSQPPIPFAHRQAKLATVADSRSMTRRKDQRADNRIVYQAKDVQLIARSPALAEEIRFCWFREFELAGAKAEEVRLTADAFDVAENRTGIVTRRLADDKHPAICQLVLT